MLLKKTYSLSEMFSRFELPSSVDVGLKNPTSITFWKREIAEQGNVKTSLCCDAVVELTPPEAIVAMFESWKAGVLPIDRKHPPDLPYKSGSGVIVDVDGRITPKWAVPMSFFPPKFRDFCRGNEKDLSAALRAFVTTLRWAQGASGGHKPYASVGFLWSLDGESWQHMPTDHRVVMISPKGIDARAPAMAQVAGLLEKGFGEPFAHELLREAVQISGSSPRSALLIGVSALEFGLKSYLADLIPGSQAIVEKMPSPPVVEIVQEIVPSIWKESGISSSLFPLDDKNRDYLKKWILKRNKLAHGAIRDIDDRDLGKFLDFVRALLYQLDAERGHSWARVIEWESVQVLGES